METSNNKRLFFYKRSLNMMRLAVKIGCISEIVHLALFYYRMNNYERSLRCLQKAQNKMSTPDGLYMNKRYLLKKIHSHTMEDVSMTDRMRKCLICDIGIYVVNAHTLMNLFKNSKTVSLMVLLFYLYLHS